MKLGKNWYESNPYFSERVGLSPDGIGPRSVRLFQGPAALASITHSMGLEYGVFCDGSPANENVRCGPLEPIGQGIGERVRLVERFLGFRREAAERRGVQIRAVVALREAVEEDLPVALQLGVESIDLVRSGKGIALDAMGQVAEVISAPTRCCAG